MRPLRRLQATPGRCDRLDGRPRESSVAFDEDRQGRIDQPEAREQEVGLGLACRVPLVRLRVAREEIAKTVVLGVHPPTNDPHHWAYRAHVVDTSAALKAYGSRAPSAVENCRDVIGEHCGVLAQEAVAGIGIDPKLSGRQAVFRTT